MKLREAVPDTEPQIVPISASKRVNISHLKETIEANLDRRGVEKPEW
jgi:translation initiation factor 2 gamma subunit (eIF-2gamma)